MPMRATSARPARRLRWVMGETTTELVRRWADELRDRSLMAAEARRMAFDDSLSGDEVTTAERVCWRCLGERDIGELTLGELALVPPALEEAGLPSLLARRVCRSLGRALRAAMGESGRRGLARTVNR